MGIALVLFWILLVWGLIDGDLYAREAVVFGLIWALLLAGIIAFPTAFVWFVVPLVLLDIVLLFKVVGTDILIH